MSLYTVYPPQKDAPAPVHVRAYETAQQLLCHGNYCKPILSPVRASFQQPSAVRPWPDELLRLPKHHQLQAAVCRPPRYWPDELRRPPKYPRQGSAAETMSAQTRPKFTPAHDSVAAAVSHKHHSIIRVGAGLIQFVHSRTCSSAANVIPNKFLFQPFHGSHSAQNLFRLRTNSESRHCSLRVLQLVVGEHAASPHAPSAGRGHCAAAIRSALDDTVNRPDGGFRDPMESCATGLAALEESSKHSAVRLFQPSAAARASGAGRWRSSLIFPISGHLRVDLNLGKKT